MVILNDRNSEICRTLAAQDKVYSLSDALEVMDKLMALDTKSNSLDDAREYIKALAPWIKDEQVERLRHESGRCLRGTYSVPTVSLEM